MAGVLLQYSSTDQPISPYKSHIRTTPQKKGTNVTTNRSLISRPCENFGSLNIPHHHHHHGIIQTPPPPPHPPRLFQSYPPFSVRQQPPLLPLPISKPQNFNSSHGVRGLSCPPPTNRKLNNNNRTRDSSTLLTPRKSKPQATRKEEKLKPGSESPPKEGGTVLISSAAKPLGPDPKYLPMNVSKILTTATTTTTTTNTFSSLKAVVKDEAVEFSGSVAFTISPPPPSSLPLPTFSLRPKLSCNAQAAGVDAGATDDLRRLLRLR